MQLPSVIDDASSMASNWSHLSDAASRASVPISIVADAAPIQDDDIPSEATAGHRGISITDPNLLNSYTRIMKDTNPEPRLYRGNIVDASHEAVIKHLVEDWKEHVTESFCPKINADYTFQYGINGTWEKTKYFAIDGIYLDLLTPINIGNSHGRTVDDGRVCIVFPTQLLNKLNGHFMHLYPQIEKIAASCEHLRGNGCFSATRFEHLSVNSRFCVVSARVCKLNPASLTFVHTHVDQNGCVLSATHENVGLLTSPDLEPHVYKICGFFTASRGKHSTELNLVGVRAFSIHDHLFETNKLVNATAFGV
jgi:hypothetical protein